MIRQNLEVVFQVSPSRGGDENGGRSHNVPRNPWLEDKAVFVSYLFGIDYFRRVISSIMQLRLQAIAIDLVKETAKRSDCAHVNKAVVK